MKVPYRLMTLAEASELLQDSDRIYVDTETVGLYGRIRLLQIFADNLTEVILVEWPEPLEIIAFLSRFKRVWHNAHYDLTTIQIQSGTSWVAKHGDDDDTLLLSRIKYYANQEFSLDIVLFLVLDTDPYLEQQLDKKVLQKADWGVPKLTEDMLLYAATDVYYMPKVWAAVKDCCESFTYKLDMLTLNYCLDFQQNGMPVDDDRLFELEQQTIAELAEIDVPVNVNSWQQVRPYIGENESDDLALATFALSGNSKADAVRKKRKLLKRLSFLQKFKTDTGVIFGKFKPLARSGRLTSDDQNLQQLPRSTKGVFGFTDDTDEVLIYSDYAQLELRTICAITACRRMADLFYAGEDLHGFTAEMIFGKDYTPEQRQLSKTYNFSFLYGGGLAMLISILIKTANILLTEAEADRDRRRWRNLWLEIYRWQEKGIAMWRKGKAGSTPLGRKYVAKMMTDQLNIENQGAGAEVAKLALHYFQPALNEFKKEGVKLRNFIHDSFILSCPNDPLLYQAVSEELAKAMQQAWFEFSKVTAIKDLPMPIEVKVGKNWGDLEKDTNVIWNYLLQGQEYYNEQL